MGARNLWLTINHCSTLSHQFYQVMVGQEDFGLGKWKKLMMDSLEYSVWKRPVKNEEEGEVDCKVEKEVWVGWEAKYKEFVRTSVKQSSHLLQKGDSEKAKDAAARAPSTSLRADRAKRK